MFGIRDITSLTEEQIQLLVIRPNKDGVICGQYNIRSVCDTSSTKSKFKMCLFWTLTSFIKQHTHQPRAANWAELCHASIQVIANRRVGSPRTLANHNRISLLAPPFNRE